MTSSADSDLWIVPAGGIDPGETSEQAAVREVCEEVIFFVVASLFTLFLLSVELIDVFHRKLSLLKIK